MGVRVAIDNFVDSLERAASKAAIVPVVGTVTGALKVVGGVIQVTAAIATAILLFIPALATGEIKSLGLHSWTHIKHGAANILAGIIEAIPLVGTIASFRRTLDYDHPFYSGGESRKGKFMPYQSLIDFENVNGKEYSFFA